MDPEPVQLAVDCVQDDLGWKTVSFREPKSKVVPDFKDYKGWQVAIPAEWWQAADRPTWFRPGDKHLAEVVGLDPDLDDQVAVKGARGGAARTREWFWVIKLEDSRFEAVGYGAGEMGAVRGDYIVKYKV